MRVADISWMEKKKERGRTNYLLVALILTGLLAIGYVSEHPSVTGFAIFETTNATIIDFGHRTLPLGASIEVTINGQKYEKNLISILGQPYEIFFGNATVYGWDADIAVPLEIFEIAQLAPGIYTIDAALVANGEMLDMKTVTIETGAPELESQPAAESPVPEPIISVPESPKSPTIEQPAEPEPIPLAEPAPAPASAVGIVVPTISDPAFAAAIPRFTSQEAVAAARLPSLDGIDVASIPIIPSAIAPETEPVFGVNTFLATVGGEPIFKTYVQGECGGAIACNCTDIVTASRTLVFNTDFVLNGTCTTFGLTVASGIVLDCGFNNITGDAGITDQGINTTLANSTVIGNCTLQKFGDGVFYSSRADNITLRDSHIINTSGNNIDGTAGAANWTIVNNTFNESEGSMIDLLASYFVIKDNKFSTYSSSATPHGIQIDDPTTIYNNVTNNTFNITVTGARAISFTYAGNNNSFWRNTFDTAAFTENDRTTDSINKNFYCVNDGSGRIGNKYLNGSGEYRVAKDCGPVPNIGTWNVDPTAAGNIPFSLSNTPDAANFLTISDAVANVNMTKSIVNASPVLNDTRKVFLDNADNVTIECNNAVLQGPGPSAGASDNAIDIEDSFNSTIRNCRFSRWGDTINVQASGTSFSSDYNRIENNIFNLSSGSAIEIDDDRFDFTVILNNSFNYSGAAHINSVGGGDNNTVKDNTFIGSNSSAHGINFQSADADWWNVTNNTFNITGASSSAVVWTSASASNMSIWRNTLDGVGFHDLTRTNAAVVGSSFCVNDGSGRIGNRYLNGSASKRIGGDCGPTPNIGTYNVDPTLNGIIVFSTGTNVGLANFSQISDAIGNVNATKSIVNVSPGYYNQTSYFKAVDNVTLECNGAVLNGSAGSSTGIDIDESVNITIQNCNFSNWGDSIVADAVGLTFSSDYVRIQNNRFTNTIGDNIEIDDDLFDYAIIYNNNFSNPGSNAVDSVAGGDNITVKDNIFLAANASAIYFESGSASWWNITNNTFNVTSTTSYSITWSAGDANMSIWRNIFDGSGIHEVTREHAFQKQNDFCVDDGSGAVGNYYVNRSGRHHYVSDCGPTPKLTSYNVNPDANGRVVFSNSTDSGVANYTSISNAVANVNSTHATINVSPAKNVYNDTIDLKGIDNVTIECNEAEITGPGTVGTDAFTVDEASNITIQNCNITRWGNAFDINAFGNFSSDHNVIHNNKFLNMVEAIIFIQDDLFDFTLIDNNTFAEAGGIHIHANAGGDNITVKNNNFTDVAGSGDTAIRFEDSNGDQWNVTNNTFNITSDSSAITIVGASSGNHTIWRNNFYNNTNDVASDGDTSNWNISNLGNYWSTFDSTGEGCTTTRGKEDAEGHAVCDTGFFFDVGKNDSLPSTESFVILIDADNDTFFVNGANRTHPRDCDDSDPLVQPLRNNSVNYSINKTFTLCPGMVNTSIFIQNSSVRLNCNSTTIVDRGVGGFGVTIEDNDSINITGCGIVNFTTGVSVLRSVNFRFINSTINNSGIGLDITNLNDSVIEGNNFYNLTSNAIEMRNFIFRNNVSYNTIRNTSGAENIIMEGNVTNSTFNYNNITNVTYGIIFRGNATSSGRPLNNTVSNNIITTASVAALSFQARGTEPNRPENFSFANNTLQNSVQGIDIQSLYNSTFAFTKLANNNRQLNITASNDTTLSNTSFTSIFITFINNGSNISTFNFTYSNDNGDVKFFNFTNPALNRNISVNSSNINISSTQIVVENGTGLNLQAQITFRGITHSRQPNVLRSNILCDPNTDCLVEAFSAGAGTLVFNTTQMGTFTLTSESFEELKATGRTANPPSSPPLPVMPVEVPAEAKRGGAAIRQVREEAGTSRRFAAGEGIILLEARQDGAPVFVNALFGRPLVVEPGRPSTLELTVQNVVSYDIADLGLSIDSRGIEVESMFPSSVPLLKKDATAIFTVRLRARAEKKEQAVNLLWAGTGARLEKKFDVRIEKRSQQKTAAAFIFKRWLAPSLTVLVMFLTGTILLMGIQTFGAGQVEKVTQGIVGPVFRDTLVDENTLRRLIRAKLMSHYGTLWTTRSAYMKFRPQFPQLKLIKLSTDGLRTAGELNARFHVGMEMATILAFATRKKLIAALDLMPGKILTTRDLPVSIADEVDGVDIVNPFGADVPPDRKLVLDSCISLPEYTAALMEHLVAGLSGGFTYEQLTSRLLAAGWPTVSISNHLTALKAEIGYLERCLLDVYFYTGFSKLEDEKTKEKAFSKLFEHGHDHRLVSLAFSNITKNYRQLCRFLSAGLAAYKSAGFLAAQLVKQGWDQKIVDRALAGIKSETEEKEKGKEKGKKKKKEEREEKEAVEQMWQKQSTQTPQRIPHTTDRKLLKSLAAADVKAPEEKKVPKRAPVIPNALRLLTSSVRDSVIATLAKHEEEYLRGAVEKLFAAAHNTKPAAGLEKTFAVEATSQFTGKGYQKELVERIVAERLPALLASAREEERKRPITQFRSPPLPPRKEPKGPEKKARTLLPLLPALLPALVSMKEKVAAKEQAYLQDAVEQLFAAARKTQLLADIEKTFANSAATALVKKGHSKETAEQIIAERLPALLAGAREEVRQYQLRTKKELEQKKQEQKKSPSPPGLLSLIKEKIAAKEQAYVRGYVEQLFDSEVRAKGFSAIRTTFVSAAIIRLTGRGYHQNIVERVVKEVFARRCPAAAAEEKVRQERFAEKLAASRPAKKEKQQPAVGCQPDIFATVRCLIAGKEEGYIRRFAREFFAAGKTAEEVVRKLAEKGHDAKIVSELIKDVPRPLPAAPKQAKKILPHPAASPPKKCAPRLMLDQRLLDTILEQHDRGASLGEIRSRLQRSYGWQTLSFHLSLAEKMSRCLKKQR